MDEELIEKAYTLYFKDLYHFLLAMTKEKELAEDLTSETFMIFINKVDTIKKKESIKSWLFSVGKNLYLQYLRKNRGKMAHVTDEYIESISSDIDIEKQVLAFEKVKEAKELLGKMDEEKRRVFIYRVIFEMSYDDIAKKMNKSCNWACVTFYRVKKQLEASLMEGEDGK